MRKIHKINFGLKLKKPVMRIGYPKGKPFKHSKKLLNMNWKQTKKRFPGLNPMGDIDFDGTRNKFDCRPLDPNRDGKVGDWVRKKLAERRVKKEYKKATREIDTLGEMKRREARTIRKAEKRVVRRAQVKKMQKYDVLGKLIQKTQTKKVMKPYRTESGETAYREVVTQPKIVTQYKKIAKPVRRTTEQVMEGRTQTSGRTQAGPGRPKGVYKHTSPLTGRKVPATVFYKHSKKVRSKQRETAQQSRVSERRVMARRGVPPQVTEARQQARIEEVLPEEEAETIPEGTAEYEVQEEVNEMPVGYRRGPYGVQSVHRGPSPYPKYKVVTDVMTGRKVIKSLPPKEKWTQ